MLQAFAENNKIIFFDKVPLMGNGTLPIKNYL